ncbi:uncharacterized protein N0V89_010001 [Didymosphaeria variabile]|uniref:Ecp2 effector protein domain-containing protein n=1 Tax=Didymosphaeria variabile TaxID=1932322 RepID=A0A9W8XGP3_9PLEO|nr:uncharacterized protein N0V89_010001 [Didymosphaeria variabile]KAJ4348623.1 hypothetical protein N0V89_010001 [Didymosphaeria variabile]
MRFFTIAFALASATTGLAAAVARADAVEATVPVTLIEAYSEKSWKGNQINIGTDRDVTDHPETDGSTATCFNVAHNFISSLTMTPILGAPWSGMRPYGCNLYAEDNCKGQSVWIEQGTWADVSKLSDLNSIAFDKRTSSLKCWLRDS